MQRKMEQENIGKYLLLLIILCFLAETATAQFSAQPPPSSPDFSGLTAAMDRNVVAIGNMTASNERTVGKLQETADVVIASNDRNVDAITRSVDRMLPSLDGLSATTQDVLDTWHSSMKPSVDALAKVGSDAAASISDVERLGKDALRKWDLSVKPSIDDIRKLGGDALDKWDGSGGRCSWVGQGRARTD